MNKQSIVYQIIRCKRKSTALYVKEGGNVVVRAPFFVSNEQIDGFVQSHYRWILQKQSEQQNLQQKKERFSVTDQDTLTVLGREYPWFMATKFILTEQYSKYRKYPFHK